MAARNRGNRHFSRNHLSFASSNAGPDSLRDPAKKEDRVKPTQVEPTRTNGPKEEISRPVPPPTSSRPPTATHPGISEPSSWTDAARRSVPPPTSTGKGHVLKEVQPISHIDTRHHTDNGVAVTDHNAKTVDWADDEDMDYNKALPNTAINQPWSHSRSEESKQRAEEAFLRRHQEEEREQEEKDKRIRDKLKQLDESEGLKAARVEYEEVVAKRKEYEEKRQEQAKLRRAWKKIQTEQRERAIKEITERLKNPTTAKPAPTPQRVIAPGTRPNREEHRESEWNDKGRKGDREGYKGGKGGRGGAGKGDKGRAPGRERDRRDK